MSARVRGRGSSAAGAPAGIVLALVAAGLLAAAGPARAWFEESDVGSRAIGFARAYTAIADDPSALYWNPAGLATLGRGEVALTYSRPYSVPGLTSSYGSVALPGGPGTAAASWHHVAVADALHEDTYTLGAGREIYRGGGGVRVSLGAALKIARLSFPTYPDPETGATVDFGSATKMAADAGALVFVTPKISLAAVVRNLGAPAFNLTGEEAGGTSLPVLWQLGAAYRWDRESTVAFDLRKATDGKAHVNLGAEIWFYESFAMRAGLTGSDAAGGISVKSRAFLVDLGFLTNQPLGISYRASLRVPFGRKESQP